jgi:DNA-binding transcriptional regulator WhiA
MNMKKLLTILAIFLSVQFVEATPTNDPKKELTEAQQLRLAEMEQRLEEIKAMDFKSMSKDEVKSVRFELKEMKKEAKRAGNGVYISVGAIIVILLLLILIL